jgi:hypothetical protein
MLLGIVIATWVPQAHGASQSHTKTILDVGGFHLAPSMTIALVVHALHLSKMASWNMDGWKFKDDVIVKCDGQKGNILDFDLVVV